MVFLIIALSILIMGFVIFVTTRAMMIHQYTASVQNQILIYFEKLDSELQGISAIQENIVTSDDLLYMKNRNIEEIDFDLVSSINRVMDQVLSLSLSSTYVESANIHLTELKRTLSSDKDSFRKLQPDTIDKIASSPGGLIKYYDDNLHMITLPLSASSNFQNSTCVIETELKKSSFTRSMDGFTVSKDSVSMLVFEEFDFFLSSNDNAKSMYSKIDPEKTGVSVQIDGKNYFVLTYYSKALQARYAQFIPESSAFAEINILTNWYLLFGSLIILTVGIYGFIMYGVLKKPIDILADAFKKVQAGDFMVNITHSNRNEFGVIYHSFNKMVVKIRQLINDNYIQKILAQRAELRQLQAQINPHFLYNSFFTLKKRISAAEYNEAKEFADMLGNYFSFITKNYSDNTALIDEVRHAKIYAEIQGIRFKERIEIDFDKLPEKYEKLTVPRLILQPILENAFKYGLEDLEFDGVLQVKFTEEEGYLTITIEDNSGGFDNNTDKINELVSKLRDRGEQKEISGLLNIHKRMQLFTNDMNSGLSLEKSDLGGLRVNLKIPTGELLW